MIVLHNSTEWRRVSKKKIMSFPAFFLLRSKAPRASRQLAARSTMHPVRRHCIERPVRISAVKRRVVRGHSCDDMTLPSCFCNGARSKIAIDPSLSLSERAPFPYTIVRDITSGARHTQCAWDRNIDSRCRTKKTQENKDLLCTAKAQPPGASIRVNVKQRILYS